jgi:hypothetical protein
MRHLTSSVLLCVASLALAGTTGCEGMGTYNTSAKNTAPVLNKHPTVEITGNDGTVLRGELMNGSVTIDCDQGQLTLLTDHIRTITLSPESDTIDSASIKVSGKIMESQFQLRSEHGVFTLMKERLKRIDFKNDGFTTPIESAPASSTRTSTITTTTPTRTTRTVETRP